MQDQNEEFLNKVVEQRSTKNNRPLSPSNVEIRGVNKEEALAFVWFSLVWGANMQRK